MGRIIAIANQKGGVGKTTTSINLAASIAEMGKRVLAIDLDPQGNMTSGLGVDKNEVENTVYELMLDECSINESIQDTVVKGLRLIPSNVNLAGAEIELLGINDKEYILKTAVDYIRDDYDFIVIDCPPSLNMLTVNAMTTADTVLVPIQCEYYALEGLSQLIHTINLVQERLNPNLQMEGVVFTMYDVRTKLSNQVVENVKEFDVEKYGKVIEVDKHFPKRINVEFIQILDRNNIKMRVWERGAGETLACGTGACASVVSCVINNLTGRKVTVELLGGNLEIEWNEKDNLVYMTGPAVTVFEGELTGKI